MRPVDLSAMPVSIAKLTEHDLQRVDDLGRNYRSTIGFLTEDTLREYLQRGRVLGAISDSGDLIGYLLYADYPDRFRLAQLCVSDESRGQGVARRLFDALKATATTQKVIKLRCRRDFPAHHMWPKLGFIPVEESAGRSVRKLPLTLWCYNLKHDDELGLWKSSESALDVVVDAQIFYDFYAEDTQNSLISKGLMNDFLVDSLNLWVTDEIFVEIDRKSCDITRKESLTRAHGFSRILHNKALADQYTESLKTVLPYQSESQKSDIHHLAKTASSNVGTFVTKDERLIQNAEAIRRVAGINVVHPSNLITSIHELSEKDSYSPARVTGLGLFWRRMNGDDCIALPNGRFQNYGEKKGKLLETIRSFVSHPEAYFCECLFSHSEIVAIRVLKRTDQNGLVVALARIAANADEKLFSDFLIADTLAKSAGEGRQMVTFCKDNVSGNIISGLIGSGFIEGTDHWFKLLMMRCCSRTEFLEQVRSCTPSLTTHYEQLEEIDLERICAPCALSEDIPTFLVPIRPYFAMSLIDRKEAAEDLFGGDPAVLLRGDNVYYRSKSRHRMIKAPGRILWYVSGGDGGVIAMSHLDEVDTGYPREIYRKYQKYGVFDWRDISLLCGNDMKKEIMALRFSHTFLFKQKVAYQRMESIFSENGVALTTQSPIQLPFKILKAFFDFGFSAS